MTIVNNKKFKLFINISLDYADYKVAFNPGKNDFEKHIYDEVIKTDTFSSLRKNKFISLPVIKKEKKEIDDKLIS